MFMRGDPRFEAAWAAYFEEHPEILASWNHQNGYWPPGYDPDPYSPDFNPDLEEEDDEA